MYLLGDAQRFAVLQKWFPRDGLRLFEPLARKTSTFQMLPAKDAAEAFRIISLHKRTASAVVHPVAKLVATSWERANECVKDHKQELGRTEPVPASSSLRTTTFSPSAATFSPSAFASLRLSVLLGQLWKLLVQP